MKHETYEKKEGELDFSILIGDCLSIARRKWFLAVVLVLVLMAVSCFSAFRSYRPMYQASATFTVYVTNPLQSEVRGYNAKTAEQMAKTFPYILTSGALQDMVTRDLDIPAMPPVSASVLDNTNVFTLTVTAPEAQFAYDVLHSVMEHYPDVSEFVVGPTVMSLLDESGVPTEPYNSRFYRGPIKKSIVFGIGLWAVLILAMAILRSTVHNEDELSRLMNVRCVGVIPRVRSGKQAGHVCPMVDDPRHHAGFQEAIRLMRIRVEREMQKQKMQVLLVSSATPGEGKTTVSINLAKALAEKGKKVLLVDCDLRSPSVARNLGYDEQTGLSDYLHGKITIEETLHLISGSFYAAFAGSRQEYAAELLGREEAERFVAQCREAFDYVILDTPPASLLADAAEIAFVADAALLVIRQDFASKSKILDGAQVLTESGLPLIGCTMNYASRNMLTNHSEYYGDHYHHYYGQYGHYSHYGHYGEAEENDRSISDS